MKKTEENSGLIKAVIYARYSSSGQREESIEGQIRDCSEYAERNGIAVIGTYEDRALTGTSDKRPAFQRMIRDSERGQFSFVICWKSDRFARSRYDSAIYKARLKKNGVRLLYAKESIPEGPEGIILESIMEGYAEYYSANLSENVKRGNRESALKLQTCGVTCLGYRTGADKRFEIDPATAPVVKRIFTDYVAGKPAVTICAELNSEGLRTVRGGPFNKNSIRRIIQNERYCGVYDYSGVRDENGVPAIVDKETWRQAQEILNVHHRNKTPAKADGGYLLTGKIFCGHCGEPMTGESARGKLGGMYYYYVCNSRRYGRSCSKKRVRRELIEDLVVEKLAEAVHSDELIEAYADYFMRWQKEQLQTDPAEELKRELHEVEAALRNNLALIDKGLASETVASHILELEGRKADLEAGIAKAKIRQPEISRDDVIWFLTSFRDGDIEDVSWRIYLVDTFLRAVYVYDDHLLLHMNMTGNKKEPLPVKLAEEAESADGEVFENCDVSPARRRSHEIFRFLKDIMMLRITL